MTPEQIRKRAREVANQIAQNGMLRQEPGAIDLIAAFGQECINESIKNQEREAMDAGYAQGVEATEARAIKRIDELEAEIRSYHEQEEQPSKD